MRCNGVLGSHHPLAKRDKLRLYECTEYPLMLPHKPRGVRQVLDAAAAKVNMVLAPVVESNSLGLLQTLSYGSDALSFTISINIQPLLEASGFTAVPMDEADVAGGFVFAGHLRGRSLPVAAARFLEDISRELGEKYG